MKKSADSKKKLPALVWAFLIFIFAMAILNIFTPDREESAAEKRQLAQFPEFSLYELFLADEKWTLKYETYATDQFALRDIWIAAKATSERLMQKSENGGVYFAKSDYLIERPSQYDSAILEANLSAINKFASATDAEVFLTIIPNSAYVNADKLPYSAYGGDNAAIIEDARTRLEGATYIDVAPALLSHADEQLYYRTDHHMTAAGAYRVYEALGNEALGNEALGNEALGCEALSGGLDYEADSLESFTKARVSDDFRGTAAAFSGAWWVKADAIERMVSEAAHAYTLTTYESASDVASNTGVAHDGLYFDEKLDSYDEYTYFLGGNFALQIITSDAPNSSSGRKLMLIKDSFSNAIAPYLAAEFDEIHIVDMRYLKQGIRDYIANNGIDTVLIMFSAANFTTEKNLVFLNN